MEGEREDYIPPLRGGGANIMVPSTESNPQQLQPGRTHIVGLTTQSDLHLSHRIQQSGG